MLISEVMETLQLSRTVLEWAADQTGRSLEDVARTVSVRKQAEIQNGKLTLPQVIKFAKATGVPFGYLFFDTPPDVRPLPIADFRTLNNPEPLSKDFYQTYDDIEYKQSWYRDLLISNDAEPIPFVGKFSLERAKPSAVAKDIRDTLKISDQEIGEQKSADALYAFLAARAENVGILVFKNGVVGNSTRRHLSVNEFRGFVISDRYAPVVFINGSDAPAAWVFTLAHELAHIWLGDSGISDVSPNSQNRHEQICNAIAAEFLIPSERFLELWNSVDGSIANKVEGVRKSIKVSRLVIARRALELGKIAKKDYFDVYEDTKKASQGKSEAGGDFYRTLAVRNSKNFASRVAALAAAGAISLREAGNLLNTNPNNVMKFYAQRRTLLT